MSTTIRAGDIVRVNGRPAGCPVRYTRTAQVLLVDADNGVARIRFILGSRQRSFGVHLVPLSDLTPTKPKA